MDLLKKRQFDLALPLLSAMKEAWPSDGIFTAPAVMDDTSDDSSMSTDEDSTSHVANLLGYLQHVFLGEQLIYSYIGSLYLDITPKFYTIQSF